MKAFMPVDDVSAHTLGLGLYLASHSGRFVLKKFQVVPELILKFTKLNHSAMRLVLALFVLASAVVAPTSTTPTSHYRSMRRLVTSVLSAVVAISSPAAYSSSDSGTLQDQLRVVQALQREKVRREGEEERGVLVAAVSSDEDDFNIITGTVSISSELASAATDPANYPLGLMDASSLASAFSNNDKASLVVTAVGRDGPPLAARKYNLNEIKFPFLFSLRTKDLIFPYNKEIWMKSPVSRDTLAVTCILDPDGMLSRQAGPEEMFGFAISDRQDKAESSVAEGIPMGGGGGSGGRGGRGEVRVTISLKSDGREFSEAEKQLLVVIDAFLAQKQQASSKQ